MTPRRWTIRGDLIVEVIDEECLILDMRQNKHFGLNRLGLLIWRLLEQGHDERDILTALSGAYEQVEPARLAADISAFISQMESAGLITQS